MAFLDKEGLKRLWANTLTLADSKVDKIDGKDLSTNDFTDEYKEKLDNLNEGDGGIVVEEDPTVPAWAKEKNKPSYTANEVGALADTTVLADLADDATHRTVTDTEKANWNAKSEFSGNYNDLENAPNITEDGTGDLVIADQNGNIVFRSSDEGLETTAINTQSIIVNGIDVESRLNNLDGFDTIEPGAGDDTVQQTPRADKVTIADGETTPHFNFTGHDNANMAGRIEYGAVGNYSASFNGRSAALNKHAFAINNSTIAKGEESFAQGYETIAEGNSSVATGSRTWAKGLASHTEGEQTYTEGEGSHAEGALTKAMGRYSHAEGERTTTNGDNSHAEGALTQTGSFAAHAEGNATVADTNAAHAEGSETKVVSYIVVTEPDSPDAGEDILPPGPDYNDYESMEDYRQRAAACAHAEGNHSVAMNYGAHAEGVSTKAYGHSSHTEGWDTQTGELMTTEDSGQTYQIANPELGMGAHAEGFETKAIANYSHAEGNNTIAEATAAHAEGSNTHATEMYAHAEGFYTHADGQSSHAEGENTTAEGQYSHAEGFNTKAANGATHTEGYNVVAMGDRSHAEGDSEPNAPETYNHTFTFDGKTYNGKDGAYGAYSHREGRNTLTLGDGSHVEGIGNIAHGLASHAEGFMTEAIGVYSHASGLGTRAAGDAQTVVGMYNADDPNAKFIVGAGYSDYRQNAFTVGNDGADDYFTLGSTKITPNDLNKIEQHAAMINCITSATKNGSIALTQFGNAKYQGTFTLPVAGIVTGCVNHDSIGSITVKNTGTTATITVRIIKNASSNPLDDTTGSYNFTYYYIPIST